MAFVKFERRRFVLVIVRANGIGSFSLRWCFIDIGLGLVDIQEITSFMFLFLHLRRKHLDVNQLIKRVKPETDLLFPSLFYTRPHTRHGEVGGTGPG